MASASDVEGSLGRDEAERIVVSPLVEISNAMMRVYKDQFGRGPTLARTNFAGPNTVVCTLENTFTLMERNLQAMGEHQRLRDLRLVFQYAESSKFIEPVERITGRRVRGFLSAIDTHADIASETFVLEPAVSNVHASAVEPG